MLIQKNLFSLFVTALFVGSLSAIAEPPRPRPEKSEVHHYERHGDQLTHTFTQPDGSRYVSTSTIGGRNHGSSTTIVYDRNNRIIQSRRVDEHRNENGTLGRTIEVSRDRNGVIRTTDTNRSPLGRDGRSRTVVDTYKGDVYKRLPRGNYIPPRPRRR